MIEEANSKAAQSLLRRLRNANRGDTLLVRICNDTIAMIKNLTKASQRKGRGDEETAKKLRVNLASNAEWLANWDRERR
jgi:flagellar basal body L-ring protein FlgH